MQFQPIGADLNGNLPPLVKSKLGEDFAPVPRTTGKRAVGQDEILFNVKDYGALGNASANDSVAIANAIAAMTTTGSSGLATLYFPPGQYNFGKISTPAGKSISIRGAGKNITELRPANGTVGDFITIGGSHSSVSDLTLNGRVSVVTGIVDALVVNAPYFKYSNVRIQDFGGDGITVGKAGSAIGSVFTGFQIRNTREYGVHVNSTFSSTDCIWQDGDVGQTGKSCIRIDEAAQNMSMIHVWNGGMIDPADNHGFWIRGRRQILVGCQSETNMGYGYYVDGTADGHHLNASANLAFGNMLGGVRVDSANFTRFTGVVERNGVSNPGNNQTQYAGVVLSSAGDSLIDVIARDVAASIPAIAGPAGSAFSYPGRDGSVRTQTYGVAETGAANRNYIRGYIRGEDHRSSQSMILLGGQSMAHVFMGQNNNNAVPQVASASPFTVPPSAEVIEVTGNVAINNLVAGKLGRRVTLVFTHATPAGISAGATGVRLSGGAFAPTTGGSITLVVGPGGSWYETNRAV